MWPSRHSETGEKEKQGRQHCAWWVTFNEQHVNDCAQLSKRRLCKKKRETGALYNTLLSPLASFNLPLQPWVLYLCRNISPNLSSPMHAGVALAGARRPGSPAATRGRWLCERRLQTGTPSYTEPVTSTTPEWHILWGWSHLKALCCESHKEAFGRPWSPLSSLTWAARTESLSFTVGLIAGGWFHLFQYLVDDKMTLESWATRAAEQASKPIVGETKITCPLQIGLRRQLDQNNVFQ